MVQRKHGGLVPGAKSGGPKAPLVSRVSLPTKRPGPKIRSWPRSETFAVMFSTLIARRATTAVLGQLLVSAGVSMLCSICTRWYDDDCGADKET
jgi:hypothetical protein